MIIWLFLRHFKIYHWAKYIPISNGDNFNIFAWDNWVWKSSILESLDCFFNDPKNDYNKWNINLKASKWWLNKSRLIPFIAPIFLIKKDLVWEKNKWDFESLDNFFRNEIKSARNFDYFILHRDELLDSKFQDYFLVNIWIRYDSWKIFFHYFADELSEKLWYKYINNPDLDSDKNKDKKDSEIQEFLEKKYNKLYDFIKEKYIYLYFPLDLKPEEYTKLEKTEMQRLINKDLKDNILISIWWKKSVDDINKNLWTFLDDLEKELKDYKYWYDWKKKNIYPEDLIEKIIEAYFFNKLLEKKTTHKSADINIRIKDLSSWEKRKVLIDLASIYLSKDNNEKSIVIWIDEPEASLHSSKCYKQFKKLLDLSNNAQTLITTHWYWFLPIVSKWNVNILNKSEDESIEFNNLDLRNYNEQIKKSWNNKNIDIELKSNYDLVNSIFSSLREWEWDWIICEWYSDKLYLEWFIKLLNINNEINIIPVWWVGEVTNLYNFLQLPISTKWEKIQNKVFCLIDTDDSHQNPNKLNDNSKIKNKLIYKRLCEKEGDIELFNVWLDSWTLIKTDIEDSLSPIIYFETLKSFSDEIGLDFENTPFKETKFSWNCLDLRDSEKNKIKKFFSLVWNKTRFAKKYIDLLKDNWDVEKNINNWFFEIVKKFGWKIWKEEFNENIESKNVISNNISYKNYNLNRLNNYKKQKDVWWKKLKAKKYIIDDIIKDNKSIFKEDVLEILKLFYKDYWGSEYLNSEKFKDNTFDYLKLYYLTMRWSNAKWIFNNWKILVFKWSIWPKILQNQEIENEWYAYRNRPKLINEWVIKEEGDNIIFIKDYEFDSPSSACSLVTWWSFNWWDVWKDENWKTLDENERKVT